MPSPERTPAPAGQKAARRVSEPTPDGPRDAPATLHTHEVTAGAQKPPPGPFLREDGSPAAVQVHVTAEQRDGAAP